MKVSYLILDFCKSDEGRNLLESIKKFANHDKSVVYMCNGGTSDYAYKFYEEGLIDTLIVKKQGDGGGFGQTDLFRYCKTEWAFFVQVDQLLMREISEDTVDYLINLIKEHGWNCVDLNGDQSNRDAWTDRAHFINVNFFNSLGPFPNGGPGNSHHLKWNEQHLQEKFAENNYRIAHVRPLYFQDCGCWAIRENPDGSIWKHRTDTKELFLISGPVKEKYIYPFFSDIEWAKVFQTQTWKGIPEKEKAHSFKVWD